MSIRIDSPLVWRAEAAEEACGGWVAFCDALGISTEGESLDELRSVISESMDLLVQDLLAEGEVEQFLRNKGVRYSKDEAETPAVLVPWQLIAAGQDGFERAAA